MAYIKGKAIVFAAARPACSPTRSWIAPLETRVLFSASCPTPSDHDTILHVRKRFLEQQKALGSEVAIRLKSFVTSSRAASSFCVENCRRPDLSFCVPFRILQDKTPKLLTHNNR
jgi:hypothetical protein